MDEKQVKDTYPVFQNLEELQEYVVELIYPLDLSNKNKIYLLDAFKTFGAEYARLLVAGKIPEEQQYKHDENQALEFYRKQMEELPDERADGL